jgi:hypothetical protein
MVGERVYDFNAQVVKDCKRTSVRSKQVSLGIFHNKCIMKGFYYIPGVLCQCPRSQLVLSAVEFATQYSNR